MRATVRDTGFSAVSSVCGHISVCVHIGEKERGRLREGVLLWGIGIRVRMGGRTQGMERGDGRSATGCDQLGRRGYFWILWAERVDRGRERGLHIRWWFGRREGFSRDGRARFCCWSGRDC